MRLFAAIDISEEVRANLRAFLARLKPLADLKWSPVENLHITTNFLGEWPEARIGEMTFALASVPTAGEIGITVREIGWYPNPQRPRVFWAGVEGGESLRSLAAATEAATATLGVPVENRAYSPHLTLARLRDSDRLEGLKKTLSVPATGDGGVEFGTFRATAFYLCLSLSGRYTKLAEFPLVPRS